MSGVKGRSGRHKEDSLKRFWAKVGLGRGCWEWEASKDKDGYGKFWFREKHMRAHVVSYIINVGEVPDGMKVCHTCDNTGCVRPDHLFVGTTLENNHDMVRKGRQHRPKGNLNAMSVLTEDHVREIRELRANGEKLYVIGEQFGISASHVHHVVHGKLWGHVH